MAKLKLVASYSKQPPLIYISHLDVARIFSRAIRRAQLPVKLTEGFNPHYRVGFKRALKLGLESAGEEVIFYLTKEIDPQEFVEAINEKIPQGIRIEKANYTDE